MRQHEENCQQSSYQHYKPRWSWLCNTRQQRVCPATKRICLLRWKIFSQSLSALLVLLLFAQQAPVAVCKRSLECFSARHYALFLPPFAQPYAEHNLPDSCLPTSQSKRVLSTLQIPTCRDQGVNLFMSKLFGMRYWQADCRLGQPHLQIQRKDGA